LLFTGLTRGIPAAISWARGHKMAETNKEADRTLRDEKLKRLVVAMEDNLRVLDELGNYPEFGARLADVIDGLRRESIG
jgi:hypothetical protein